LAVAEALALVQVLWFYSDPSAGADRAAVRLAPEMKRTSDFGLTLAYYRNTIDEIFQRVDIPFITIFTAMQL
jgi:hypothetical protein